MKKTVKSLSALLMVLIMLLATTLTAGAADDSLQVDGRVSYNVGDTLTYTVCLADTAVEITGVEFYIKYDPAYLQVDENSISSPKLSSAVINPTYTSDTVYMSWLNVTRGVRFDEKGQLITLDFKVLKAGSTNINFWVEEMFSTEGGTINTVTQHTLTAEYSDNGTGIKDDVPPIPPTDPDFMAEHQGEFINYEDGKGQDNADVGDDHIAVTGDRNAANNGGNDNNAAPAVTDSNGNVAATNSQGQVLSTDSQGNYLDEDGNILTTDEKGNYITKDGKIYQAAPGTEQESVDVGPIIIIVAIVVIAVAIVVIIVLKNRSSKKETDSEPESHESDSENGDE